MKHIEILKHEHAMSIMKRQACTKINRSLEIVTNSKAPSMVVDPPKFLDSGAPSMCHFSSNAPTIKAPNLSRFERFLTYIKYTRWGFWYPYFLGSYGVSLVRNPSIFIFIKNKNI